MKLNPDDYPDFSPSDYEDENDFNVTFSVEARCRIVGEYYPATWYDPPEDERELIIQNVTTNDAVIEFLKNHTVENYKKDRDHSIQDLTIQINVKPAPIVAR
jgi:hypothetical protein